MNPVTYITARNVLKKSKIVRPASIFASSERPPVIEFAATKNNNPPNTVPNNAHEAFCKYFFMIRTWLGISSKSLFDRRIAPAKINRASCRSCRTKIENPFLWRSCPSSPLINQICSRFKCFIVGDKFCLVLLDKFIYCRVISDETNYPCQYSRDIKNEK